MAMMIQKTGSMVFVGGGWRNRNRGQSRSPGTGNRKDTDVFAFYCLLFTVPWLLY
jgi:hypothetical protein